jgi:hypothetical protein
MTALALFVEEFRQLTSGEKLLRFSSGILPASVVVIDDFGEACAVAFDPWTERGARYVDWNQVRELSMADCHAIRYEKRSQRPAPEALEEIERRVHAYLPYRFDEASNEVIADLTNCATWLSVAGALDPLHTQIWNAYRAGGWPCGQAKAVPTSKLCVFWDAAGATPEPPDSPQRKIALYHQRRARGEFER